MMGENFAILIGKGGSSISLRGELDILTVGCLQQFFESTLDTLAADLTIDCARLLYIDSCGINSLLGALQKMQQRGLDIKLMNVNKNIRKLFEVTRLADSFGIAS